MNYLDISRITSAKLTEYPRYGRDVYGYGSKIPLGYMVRLDGRGPWRRVYCICYSNAGTLYVIDKGEPAYIAGDLELQHKLYHLTESLYRC